MALFVTIDGTRVAFTGDAFFAYSPTQASPGVLRHNVIFRNHVESDSHLKSIRNLIEHEPTLVAPGHGEPYLVTRPQLLATEKKMQKQETLFKGIVADPDANFGLDPSWCSIYPYQMLVAPGDRPSAEIRVRNYRGAPMKVEVALVAPVEWKVTPDLLKLEIPPGTLGRQSFSIQVPQDWRPKHPRFAIAADVLCDGKYLGQITEAVVELAS